HPPPAARGNGSSAAHTAGSQCGAITPAREMPSDSFASGRWISRIFFRLTSTSSRRASSPGSYSRQTNQPSRNTTAVMTTGRKRVSSEDERCSLNNPPPHLIELDGFEQRAEVAFPEPLVSLALNDLEEDRANDVLREDLQQHALALLRIAVDENAPLAQLLERFVVARDARRHA